MNDILSALKSNIVKDIVPSMTFFGMFEDGREYGPGSITIKDGVPTLFNGEFCIQDTRKAPDCKKQNEGRIYPFYDDAVYNIRARAMTEEEVEEMKNDLFNF